MALVIMNCIEADWSGGMPLGGGSCITGCARRNAGRAASMSSSGGLASTRPSIISGNLSLDSAVLAHARGALPADDKRRPTSRESSLKSIASRGVLGSVRRTHPPAPSGRHAA